MTSLAWQHNEQPSNHGQFTITVQHYGQLAELSQCDKEVVSVSANDSIYTLYQQLKHAYQWPVEWAQIKVAINDAFVDKDQPLQAGDVLVFIAPVAGG